MVQALDEEHFSVPSLHSSRRSVSLRVFAIFYALCALITGVGSLAQSASVPGQRDISEGIQLLRNGQAAQARAKFAAAVNAAPRSAEALTWRGLSENQMQQYSAAAADFRTALHLDPSMLAAHYNLALSLIRLHETDGAIEQLKIVVAAQPRSVQPLYNLAVLLEAKGTLPEAIKHLDAAHALAPNDKGVTLHLLLDSLKLNDTAKLPSLVNDLAEVSTDPEIQQQAGSALLEAGRFPDAVALLKTTREREPTRPGIDLLLARALIGNGNYAEAISLLGGASPEPTSEERAYLLGLAYTGAGEVHKAAKNFRGCCKARSQGCASAIPSGVTCLRHATGPDRSPQVSAVGQSDGARESGICRGARPCAAGHRSGG